MDRRFVVICNPSAGGGRGLKRLPLVKAELGRLGAEHRVIQTRDIDHARSEAAVAAQTGERIVAIGGDGLMRPIAAVLRHTDASLAIVPGGRGNDLARVLGIPSDPTAAARLAVEGRERAIDMAVLDGEPFLGIASFGFDSEANRIANEARLIKGNLVYLYSALRALVTWKPATFTLIVDGERHAVTGWSAGVANSQAYGGGMFVAPQADLDDGMLDVVACSAIPRRRFVFGLMPKVFRGGRHLGEPYFHAWRGATIDLASDREFEIYADGDPIGQTPARVQVDPRCLRIVVPT